MFLKFFQGLQILLVLSKNMEALDLKNVTSDDCDNALTQESKKLLATCRASIKVCVADCLGLKPSSVVGNQKEECLYNQSNGEIANLRKKKITPFKLANNSDFRIFCFYAADYAGPNLTSLAASKLCTNIMVEGFVDAFRKPKTDSYAFSMRKGEVDGVANELKYIAANYKDVRLHLSFGEWTEDSCRLYSEMIPNEERRKNFINDMTAFLALYNFTGLHLNWRYPVCWMEGCKWGPKSDKMNYALLIKELALRLKPIAIMLSCVFPKGQDMLKEGFVVNVIADNIDMVILNTRFYHGMFDRTLEHPAVVTDFKTTLSMISEAINPINMKKFIVEIFLRWNVQTLAGKTKTSMGSNSYGESSKYPGVRSFNELCSVINEQDWTVARESTENLGFHAYKDDQWVAYDDVANIRFKAKFFRQEQMLGVSFYAVDSDDFSGHCGCGKYPLLRALSEELRGQREELPDCT